jgi:foldase protein PrsA
MNRTARAMLAAPLLLAALWLAGCSRPDPSLVAVVGERTITREDLVQELVRQFRTEKDAAMQTLERRRQVLDNLVERELKVAAARIDGHFDTPEINERRQKISVEEAINKLYQRDVMDEVVTEETLRWTYEQMGVELKASHLLLRWAEDSSAVRARALEIRREIEGGLDFAEAAGRYTEEPGGQERKGDLGWFGWGRMVPGFQNAAWNLAVGELSAPVETRFGVHLILVSDRRELEHRPPFEDQRTSLLDVARNSLADSLNLVGMRYIEAMREEEGFQLDEDAVQELLTAIHTGMRPEMALDDILESLKAEGWEQRQLARWSGGVVGMDELIEGLTRTFRAPGSIRSVDDVREMVRGTALFPMLEQRALGRGLDKDPEVVAAVERRLEGIVLTGYEREVIKGEVLVSDDEVASYYQNHLADYMHPEQVRVQEIYVRDKALAEELAERARKGEAFDILAREYTERPGQQGTTGVLEPFGPGRYGKMGTAAFALEIGQISDPQPIGNAWSVVKLLERLPPKQKRLDESATSIRMKLEREARERSQADWRSRVEERVPIRVYEETLKTLFAD